MADWQMIILGGGLAASVLFLTGRLLAHWRLHRARWQAPNHESPLQRGMAGRATHFSYDEKDFFNSDGATQTVARQRHYAFMRLSERLREQTPLATHLAQSLAEGLMDSHCISTYHVPSPYRALAQRHLQVPLIVQASHGALICDMDDNWRYDLAGHGGANLFGFDFYKQCMDAAAQTVRELGPVSGSSHPIVADNVARLQAISAMEAVSFHLSGVEALQQSLTLARAHTGRGHVVCLGGAQHPGGNGGPVQSGNGLALGKHYRLQEMSEQTLHVLARGSDIACVLIDPMQALHPNRPLPSDQALVTGERNTGVNLVAYRQWLQQLREVCAQRGILLILDEVLSGFRLGYRGAQGFFGITADMVIYGEALGAGQPVGVLCGRRAVMQGHCAAGNDTPVGHSAQAHTHPLTMACVNEVLSRLEEPCMQAMLGSTQQTWEQRFAFLNDALARVAAPVRVANVMSVATVSYTRPGRYHWLFQYYLHAEGVQLGRQGTGRLIFGHNYSDQQFAQVVRCFVRAAVAMQSGRWWHPTHLSHRALRRRLLCDALRAALPWRQRSPGAAGPIDPHPAGPAKPEPRALPTQEQDPAATRKAA